MSSLSFHWRPFAEAEPNADGQVKIAGNFEIFLIQKFLKILTRQTHISSWWMKY